MNRYTLSILLGMAIIAVTGDVYGTTGTLGVALGSAMIFSGLMTNTLIYHDEIMQSNAPGAIIYQRMMNLDETLRNLMGHHTA